MTDAPPGSFRRGRALRLLLMVGLPVAALAVGGGVWLSGGDVVSTDNAYVKAPIISVAPEVSGRVLTVAVSENQPVTAGQDLLRVDAAPFRIAVERAEAGLDAARTEIEELQASYREKLAELDLARTTLAYAEKELGRRDKLARRDVVSESGLDESRQAAESARQRLAIIRQDLARIAARLGGEPPIDVSAHPAVRQARAALDAARLDLSRTAVRAPVDGVAGHLPDPGDTVAAGQTALTLVGTGDVWIEANFKETDLTWMRDGQPVEVRVDTYPDRVFRGRVRSIAQATGAEFSLLPPQNASGNWVKVVQRVPVRVGLELDDGAPPLRVGMSAEVDVHTGHEDSLPGPLAKVAEWVGVRAAKAAQ